MNQPPPRIEPHSTTDGESTARVSAPAAIPPPVAAPRRRRWPAMISLVATTAIIAAWIRSCTAFDLIEYRWGELAPLTYAQGSGDDFQYNVRTAMASQADGVIYLRRALYVSFGVPREELVRQWEHWHGWEVISAVADRGPRADEDAYYFSPLEWRGGGFGVFTTMRQGEDARVITLPHWFLAIVAISPFLRHRILSRRDRKLSQTGRCLRCGYDLRGSRATHPAAAVRCPECGSEQPLPAAPAQH